VAISAEIKSLAKRHKMRVFRKLYMKRRNTDGEYETTWQRIDDRYIKKWGKIAYGVSDVKANLWKYSGFNFELINEEGFFNDETDSSSFWGSKLSVIRTLIKVEAGYLDDNDNEYPAEPTIFIGIIGEGLTWTDQGTVTIKADHISKVFADTPASDISNLGSTQTASDIIEKVRDFKDGQNVEIFKKFINVWNIQTTTTNYNISTSTSLNNKTVWDLFRDLATAENKYIYVDQQGEFVFRSRAVTTTVAWHFSGSNDIDGSFGKSIMNKLVIKQNYDKIYNRVRVKFDSPETTTSYATKNETWEWGDSSSSFKYGVDTLEYKNYFLDAVSAATVANTLYNQYVQPKKTKIVTGKFLPELDIDDRTSITHKTGSFIGGSLYGSARYSATTTVSAGYGMYGNFKSGSGIDLNRDENTVKNIMHDVEKFTSQYIIEEI